MALKNDIIYKTLLAAWSRLSSVLTAIDIDLINESTFRYFFIEEFLNIDNTAKIQIEWQRVDLLIQVQNLNILVEFKFYLHKYTYDLKSRKRNPKGGAGDKNYGEFDQCLKKLQNFKDKYESGIIDKKYVVLVYQKKFQSQIKQTNFHKYYSEIGSHLEEIQQEKYSLHGSLIEVP